MKLKLLITVLIGAFIMSGCSSDKKGLSPEPTEQAEDQNDEMKAMQAEIDSLKSQLAEKNATEDEGSAGEEKTEDTIEEKEDTTEDLCQRFKVYIEDHSADFHKTKYALINLNDDDFPELLYVDQTGLKGVLMFDGNKTAPIASGVGDKDRYEKLRFECPVGIDDAELFMRYTENGKRFAIYKHEYIQSTSAQRASSDEEKSVFFEINERKEFIETYYTDKKQILEPNGEVHDTLFSLSDNPRPTREDYDEATKKYNDGLDKSIDLRNDTFTSIDEAFEAYNSGR